MDARCPIRSILSRIGEKWSMLVLLSLEGRGVMRFNELHREIGDISHRMLTLTLRCLEQDGLVQREVFAEVPPRVEYALTDRGRSLLPHLNALVEWALKEQEAIIVERAAAGAQ